MAVVDGRASTKATFALIHGGGSTAWDWHLVTPALRELGHEVIAVDLPTADDANGVSEYADSVIEAVGEAENLVVVAHSFGGFTAPVVCAKVPSRLLVMVAAMVPRPGEAPADWWEESGFNAAYADSGSDMSDPIATFMQDVPAELAAEALTHERHQSDARLGEPWPLGSWPDLPTRYLLCAQDGFLPPSFVRQLVQARLGITPEEIDTGHAPYLSRPMELAERLDGYWAEVAPK